MKKFKCFHAAYVSTVDSIETRNKMNKSKTETQTATEQKKKRISTTWLDLMILSRFFNAIFNWIAKLLAFCLHQAIYQFSEIEWKKTAE